MSFRLFVYYSALCGAWAALAGWALGRWLSPDDEFAKTLVRGLSLGLSVALGVSVVDALGNSAGGRAAWQILVAVAVGCLGGLAGAWAGQLLVGLLPASGSA